MTHLMIIILSYLMKKTTSEESPIVPRTDSFFEIKNWTDLLNRENGNTAVTFTQSAELFELLKDGKKEKLIGEVTDNGNLYNDKENVSLCQRRVFQIKVNGKESSDPLVWTPPSYPNVSKNQVLS